MSIVLEAAVFHDLWFWHAFFGMPSRMNDINVLQRSPLLHSIITGKMPSVNYVVNGSPYSMPYWLADGIYPNWPIFMKSIPYTQGAVRKHFAMVQEACRKDVEQAFGVLQKRFAIVRNSARSWYQEKLSSIMRACIILHNMIVEDERYSPDFASDQEFETGEIRPVRRCRCHRRIVQPIEIYRTAIEDLPA
ncbi:uncharacterized protein [Physcomitrium patens]|uniref:uncharacterized protein n=1 Tax=Physcomitrium patens TaxID=3218 RepID=UPI000D16F264|nr:uncharacterized protein LOC112284686 [Physcomitrium patens]|eukprot:XP_024380546.1 uncharacterized protein LOC112284686 [Physcomitrella patens]